MNGYRGQTILASAYSDYQGSGEREQIITGTIYDTIHKLCPKVFDVLKTSILKNKLNDPYCNLFTIFFPKTINNNVLDNYYLDTIISHSILPYAFIVDDKDTVITMLDEKTCKIKNHCIDGKKILKTIQCSNGILHIISDMIEPTLYKEFGVY